jgi:hypothetical protein
VLPFTRMASSDLLHVVVVALLQAFSASSEHSLISVSTTATQDCSLVEIRAAVCGQGEGTNGAWLPDLALSQELLKACGGCVYVQDAPDSRQWILQVPSA